MREPPAGVADADVLDAVRRTWPTAVDTVEHLPVGFGAHHWAASAGGGGHVLFVTVDQLGDRHSAESLEGAYAGAATLARSGLEFVLAPLPGRAGRFTVPFGGGSLSCTPWRDGTLVDGPVGPDGAATDAAMLARLHATPPPPDIPVWRPRVGPDLAEKLAGRLRRPWAEGPYGSPARDRLLARVADVDRWTRRYHALADLAADRPWVTTHGEPHSRNQLRTADGVLLVDWESLALAPRERDLGPLIGAGHADLVGPDRPMVELFDLEWRLDEIAQYADWFSGPHAGTRSDAVAYGGLVFELDRPDWSRPG